MSDIKILVATHKEFYRPENPLIFQVQVGSALADHHIEGILHDDAGENISKTDPTVNLRHSIGRGKICRQTIMAFFIIADI